MSRITSPSEGAVRVAVDVGPLAGRRTGVGAAVAALTDALAARDDVSLHPYLLSFRAPPRDGVTRLPIPAALAHRCWGRVDAPRVDRWLGDAAVVHGTNYVVPPTRRPRLVSVYDCWFLEHGRDAGGAVRRAGRVLARSVHHGAHVHACSEATATAVRAHFPGASVHVVPLAPIPLPPAAEECPIPELRGRPFVLSVATIERRKNLSVLVDSFGMVASDHPDVLLVIAGGDGDDRRRVDDAVLALDPAIGRRVMFTGYIADEARSWLLHHASVLAYPSLDEGFGFPLLDAMQAALPIVASDAGSIPEVAGDAALLSPPADAAALAANIGVALADESVRVRLVAAGTAQLTTFDWSRSAAAIAAVYRGLASGDGVHGDVATGTGGAR